MMKYLKTTFGLLLGLGILNTNAGLYSSTTLNAVIPDNNANGYVSSINVSGLGAGFQSLSVSLNIGGGYNGDLYAYLSHEGQLVPLLNRVGTGSSTFGYATPGFGPDAQGQAFTLSDNGAAGLHNYQDHSPVYNASGQLTGIWQPDSQGTTFSSKYQNVDLNGSWYLFLADLSQGSQSTLVNWNLEISAVPEPVDYALVIFGVLGVCVTLFRTGLSARIAAWRQAFDRWVKAV